MTVDVVVPIHRPGSWLATCVESVLASTGVRVALWLIDDDPASTLGPMIEAHWPQAHYVRNEINRGFAATSNLGLSFGSAPYVLTLNQDCALEPQYLTRLVQLLEQDPARAAAGGLLLRKEVPDAAPDGTIDTAGIEFRRGRRAVDIGQGDRDHGQFEGVREVFGVCAAAALYRRAALEHVADEHGVFCERFYMHKEDTDLAWRLRRFGYRAFVDGDAIGYHARGTRRARDVPGHGPLAMLRRILGALDQERSKPPAVRRLAFRNHVLMIVRNEHPSDLTRSFADIVAVLTAQTIATLLADPVGTAAGRLSLLRAMPSVLAARRRSLRTPPLGPWLP